MVICKSPEFFAAPSLLHSACESAIGERMHKKYSLFIGLFYLLLMACGGGGSRSTPPPAPPIADNGDSGSDGSGDTGESATCDVPHTLTSNSSRKTETTLKADILHCNFLHYSA